MIIISENLLLFTLPNTNAIIFVLKAISSTLHEKTVLLITVKFPLKFPIRQQRYRLANLFTLILKKKKKKELCDAHQFYQQYGISVNIAVWCDPSNITR